jgi:hypothetical protein
MKIIGLNQVQRFYQILFKFKVYNLIPIFIQNPLRFGQSANNESCSKYYNLSPQTISDFSDPPNYFPGFNFDLCLRKKS